MSAAAVRPACVLFDLDDVLARYDHDRRVRALAQRVGVAPARIEAELFASGLERDSDLGRYDASGHADALAARLGVPVRLDDCVDARLAGMTVDADVLALATRAATHATVAILTNNGALVRDHLPRLAPGIHGLFGGRVFCSADLGVAKPDPRLFLDAARRLSLAPAAILFVDDKPANVEGARGAGMRGHHFTGAAALEAELRACGLL